MNLLRPFGVVTPTLDGAVLQALMTVHEMASGAEVHRRCGTGSVHGVRKVLHRLVGQGVVDEIDDGNVKYYRLDTRHVAYEAIAMIANLTSTLADRARRQLHTVAGLAHASLVSLDPVTVLLVAQDQAVIDGATWRYQIGQLRRSLGEWTGDRAFTEELTAAELADLARQDDERLRGWRAGNVHVAGLELFFLVREAVAPEDFSAR